MKTIANMTEKQLEKLIKSIVKSAMKPIEKTVMRIELSLSGNEDHGEIGCIKKTNMMWDNRIVEGSEPWEEYKRKNDILWESQIIKKWVIAFFGLSTLPSIISVIILVSQFIKGI